MISLVHPIYSFPYAFPLFFELTLMSRCALMKASVAPVRSALRKIENHPHLYREGVYRQRCARGIFETGYFLAIRQNEGKIPNF